MGGVGATTVEVGGTGGGGGAVIPEGPGASHTEVYVNPHEVYTNSNVGTPILLLVAH